MSRQCVLFALLVMLVGLFPAVAQSGEGWQLADMQHLRDVTGYEGNMRNPILAPDGSAVAWDIGDELCLYTFSTETTDCANYRVVDAGISWGRLNLPAWSPDGRYIALNENYFVYLRDSDQWVYDVEAGEFINLTDDGFFGGVLQSNGFAEYPADYAPFWNPADGDLYFFRSSRIKDAPDDEVGYTLQLGRIDAETIGEDAEPELVHDFTHDLPGPFAVSRAGAFSADGTKLALSVLPSDSVTNPGTGVWIYDVETEDVEQIASLEDFNAAMPDWFDGNLFPVAVSWAGDSVIVYTEDYSSRISLRNVFAIDTVTGEITPLRDFSGVAEQSDLFEVDESGEALISTIPAAGAVSPEGSVYWFLNRVYNTELSRLSALALPPNGTEPEQLAEFEYQFEPGNEAVPTVSSDGKLLIFHMLFTFEQE